MADKWQYLAELKQDTVCTLNQHPVYVAVFPIVQIHRSRDQEVEMGVFLLTIIASNSLAKSLLLVPMLC
jgi:hypothetical protein